MPPDHREMNSNHVRQCPGHRRGFCLSGRIFISCRRVKEFSTRKSLMINYLRLVSHSSRT